MAESIGGIQTIIGLETSVLAIDPNASDDVNDDDGELSQATRSNILTSGPVALPRQLPKEAEPSGIRSSKTQLNQTNNATVRTKSFIERSLIKKHKRKGKS